MTDATALLESSALDVEIGDLQVANHLDIALKPGECWCLLGRNGVGKTTLLHTLAGLRSARGGQLRLGGRPLAQLSRRQIAQQLGILLQHQTDSFPASVTETVLQGRHPYLRAWQWESAADRQLVATLLEQLELTSLAARNVQTLSGGERQRVAIATLLAQQSDVLLLDEPANHLDVRHRMELLQMLTGDSRRHGRTLMMSLHDINLAARFCDHALLLLGDGRALSGRIGDILDVATLEVLYDYPFTAFETSSGHVWLPR